MLDADRSGISTDNQLAMFYAAKQPKRRRTGMLRRGARETLHPLMYERQPRPFSVERRERVRRPVQRYRLVAHHYVQKHTPVSGENQVQMFEHLFEHLFALF